MNYTKTLNLPNVDFRIYSEREIVDLWKKNKINSQLKRRDRTSDRCVIYEVPVPTNSIDWKTLQAQIGKDIFFKYKNMAGANVYLIEIWDIYNPSIEHNALKELKDEKRKYDIVRVRRRCRKNIEDNLRVQTELLESLGFFCDWQETKMVLSPRYDARIVSSFVNLIDKGYLYKDLKPSYWCIKCQTILNKDDMVDKTYQAYSGYVKFPVNIGLEEYGEKVYMLVWVDMLWMLAASVAIVIREGGTYSIIKHGNEALIIEKGKENLLLLNDLEELSYIDHSKLAQCECAHPFLEYDLPVVSSKYVKDRVGIGLYNVTPGHNPLDYELALKHTFKTFSVVDAEGRLTNDADKFCGLRFIEAGKFIAFELEQRNFLMKKESGGKNYPHCSSCGMPAIFRPVSQWLLPSKNCNLGFHTLKEVEELDWKYGSDLQTSRHNTSPIVGETKTKENVLDIIDDTINWYTSCHREWGMPIPIILCGECGQMIIDQKSTKAIKDTIYRRTPDSWLRLDPKKLLPSDTECPNCGSEEFVKEQGFLNPDFFSIMSVLTRTPAKGHSVQTTASFWGNTQRYSQYLALFFLITSALKNSIPFDEFHTYLFDETPEDNLLLDILFDPVNLENSNTDFLRLCAVVIADTGKQGNGEKGKSASRQAEKPEDETISNRTDVDLFEIENRIGDLKEEYDSMVNKVYLILGNLDDFDHDKDALKRSSLMSFDQIALASLDSLIQNVDNAYDSCKFHTVWHHLSEYIQRDLGFYFDAIEDRLYAFAQSSSERRSAQTVLWGMANSLIKLIAPIFPFLAEQVWSIFNESESLRSRYEDGDTPVWAQRSDDFNSIFLTSLPNNRQRSASSSALNDWTKLIDLKEQIMHEVGLALSRGIIDRKSHAVVTIPAREIVDFAAGSLDDYLQNLETACSVVKLAIGELDSYAIDGVDGRQCKRCGKYYQIDREKINELWVTIESSHSEFSSQYGFSDGNKSKFSSLKPNLANQYFHEFKEDLCERCNKIVKEISIDD